MVDYRRGRDSLLAELANIIGGSVGVGELDGGSAIVIKAIDPAGRGLVGR
jgi:hypothetical protein